jgi:hypothetical protein
MWLDVEDADDATGKTPNQLAYDVVGGLNYLRQRLPATQQVEISIYTGSWFWDAYMQTTNTFGCRLWLANYVDTPDVEWVLARLPGGWGPDQLVIWQWSNHLVGTTFNADDNIILVEDDRMKYTDVVLDGVFTSVLTALSESLALANSAGNAISHHVNTHPGGGATITTANELQELNDKINANEAKLAAFKAAIEAAASAPDA